MSSEFGLRSGRSWRRTAVFPQAAYSSESLEPLAVSAMSKQPIHFNRDMFPYKLRTYAGDDEENAGHEKRMTSDMRGCTKERLSHERLKKFSVNGHRTPPNAYCSEALCELILECFWDRRLIPLSADKESKTHKHFRYSWNETRRVSSRSLYRPITISFTHDDLHQSSEQCLCGCSERVNFVWPTAELLDERIDMFATNV